MQRIAALARAPRTGPGVEHDRLGAGGADVDGGDQLGLRDILGSIPVGPARPPPPVCHAHGREHRRADTPAGDRTHPARRHPHAGRGLARRPARPGEHEAARWLAAASAARRRRGRGRARWISSTATRTCCCRSGVVGSLAGALAHARPRAGSGRRATALLATALLVDDVSNGPRLWRRLVARRRRHAQRRRQRRGSRGPAHARRARPPRCRPDRSGLRPALPALAGATASPTLVARIDTSLPLWWPVAAGPLLVAFGALTGQPQADRARHRRLSTAVVALAADVARSPIVPGANDNLSAVGGARGAGRAAERAAARRACASCSCPAAPRR